MPHVSAGSSVDLSQIYLQLRDDLVVVPQQFAGQTVYVVEDPLGGRYHRLGAREYAFVCCLNGATSLAAALQRVNEQYSFTPDEAMSLCRWLAMNELLRSRGGSAPSPLVPGKAKRKWWLQNPLFVRVPLLTPDRALSQLTGWLGWIHSAPALLITLLLLASAFVLVAGHWHAFMNSAHEVFAPSARVQLVLTWLVLKLAHELAHGIVCKSYGGYVREAGVQFILFAPLPYVDVSSSWKFRSKWQRIHTAAAGVLIELALASIAAWVWYFTDSGLIHQASAHVVVTVAVATIAFNANPLIRGDGYYILSDYFEIPNLATLGRGYVLRKAKALMFATGDRNPPPTPVLVKIYGAAGLVWRILVAAGLLLAATRLLHGAGVLLVMAAVTSSVFSIVERLRSYVRQPPPGETPNWLTFGFRLSAISAVAILLLFFAPAPFAPVAPGVVEYSPPVIVRAAAPGFVRALHVVPGQMVDAGMLLVELESPDLVAELKIAELEVAKAEIRARMHRQRREMAACQAVEKELESLRKQHEEKRNEVAALNIYAPIAGQIVARGLDQKLGVYLAEGDEICQIGSEDRKEIRALVHQDDVQRFELRLGQPVQIRTSGQAFAAQLVRLSPRASSKLEHPSLAASYGGPLPIRLTSNNHEQPQSELLEPRFTATAILSAEDSLQLATGQRCRVYLPGTRDRLWTTLARTLRGWYRAQINQT